MCRAPLQWRAELTVGIKVVNSAAAYGVKHFVYASVMFDESKEVGDDG